MTQERQFHIQLKKIHLLRKIKNYCKISYNYTFMHTNRYCLLFNKQMKKRKSIRYFLLF